MLCRWESRRRNALRVESLETRRLLAIDLAIEVDAYTLENPGDQVTRVVRVYNNGDEDADDAIVQSKLSEQLENPTWVRKTGYAKVVHRGGLHSKEEPLVRLDAPGNKASVFGDINGDGSMDWIGGTNDGRTIVSVVGRAGVSDVRSNPRPVTGVALLPFRTQNVTALGDINADGHTDFAFGTHLVFGVPAPESTTFAPRWTEVQTGISDRWAEGVSFAKNVGDFNADGLNDVLFEMRGPENGGGATVHGLTDVVSGASIVFGNRLLGEATEHDAKTNGAVIQTLAPYEHRPDVGMFDVNADAIQDVILSIPYREIVVFGDPNLESLDLGESPIDSFDGERGYVSNHSPADTSAVVPPNHQSGTGDIFQRLTIPAGKSLIYTVTGQLKSHPETTFVNSVSTNEVQAEADWADNTTVEEGAVNLDVQLTQPELVVGEQVTFEIEIENRGLHSAFSAAIHETLSSTLLEASWALESIALFPSEIVGWDSRLGPNAHGFYRTPYSSDQDLIRHHENLGRIAGRLGDVNGDGFEDFYLGMTDFIRDGVRIYFGGEGFSSNNFEGVAKPVTLLESAVTFEDVNPLGDINGDGFGDFQLVGRHRSGRGRALVYRNVFGKADFTKASQLDPRTVTLGGLRFNRVGAPRYLAGDIDGDGMPDHIVGNQIITSSGVKKTVALDNVELFEVGDVNDDGFDDLGGITWTGDGTEATAFVHFGGIAPASVELQDVKELDVRNLNRLAQFVRGDHDLNGDGVSDLILEFGDVFVTFGHNDLMAEDKIATNRIEGVKSRATTIGDINDDGSDDLVTTTHQLETFVFHGGLAFGDSDPLSIVRQDFHLPIDPYPTAVSGFDVNADGIDDLLIANPAHGPRGEYGPAGEAFFIFGRRKTNLAGDGAFGQPIDVRPLEKLQLSISGTVTEETLAQIGQISVVPAAGQHDLNPLTNSAHTQLPDKLFADLDNDGVVGFSDFLALSHNFGMSDQSRADGDLNGDRVVDFVDFLMLQDDFGKRLPVVEQSTIGID